MGLSVKIGSFNTGTGVSDIVVNDVGFQPKVLIFYFCGRTESTDTVGGADICHGWGFATSTSDRRSAGRVSLDAQGAMAGGNWHDNAACISTPLNDGSLDAAIDLKSMDAGGFTLAVDDASSRDLRVMYLALGGTDITNAKTGQFTYNGSTGNQSITGLGFQPDIVFFLGGQDNATAPPDGQNSNCMIGFGFATASAQRVVAVAEDDGSATADSGSYIYNGEFQATIHPATMEDVYARASIVSMDATGGFTFNLLELPVTASAYGHYLAIKGGQWSIGDFTTQTDTTTTITESGLAFQPTALIFMSANRAMSTQNVSALPAQLSFGLATGASDRMAMAIYSEDGTADSETATAVEYDEIYANISSSDAIQGLCDLTGITSDGFTAIMDDADPSGCYVAWLAIGATAAAGATGTLSVTLGTATGSGTGTVAIAGTLSKTLDAATGTATGTIAIAGILDKTLGAATSTATGTVAIDGDLDQSLDAATLSAAGTVTSPTGTGRAIVTWLVFEVPAVTTSTGTLSTTLDAATLSAVGAAAVDGDLSTTLADAALSAAGAVQVSGSASVTLADATLSASGTVAISGSAAVTLADATISAAGVVRVTGQLSITLADATLIAGGTVTAVATATGTLSATLDNVTVSSVGLIAIDGDASITLADATLSSAGTVAIAGFASITLADATLSGLGAVAVYGTFSTTLTDATLTGIGAITTPATGPGERTILYVGPRDSIAVPDRETLYVDQATNLEAPTRATLYMPARKDVIIDG